MITDIAFMLFVIFIVRILSLMVVGDFREVEPRAEDEALVISVRRQNEDVSH